MRQVHELKIEENYLKAKLAGDKLFEVRVNDRGYQKGDIVVYYEYFYTGKTVKHYFEITYVTHYAQQGCYCVFGERKIDTKGKDPTIEELIKESGWVES